jgi:hypothetical protein
MQVTTRLPLILTVALLVGTLAAVGMSGARMLAKRRAAALASGDAHRSVPKAPSAALPEATAEVSIAADVIEGRPHGSPVPSGPAPSEASAHGSPATKPPSAAQSEGSTHASPVTPSHDPSADPEHALPRSPHSAAVACLPCSPDPAARSKVRNGAEARGVAPVIATASGQDWDGEERPPQGPPPPTSRPERPRPAGKRAHPAPGASHTPIVVPRSVNEWGT